MPVTYVPFSTRHLRADLRDRLHGLQAVIEGKTGQRYTMETLVNAAMSRGVEAMEAEWFSAQAAAALKARGRDASLDSGQAKKVG